jgi:hypothetical protein
VSAVWLHLYGCAITGLSSGDYPAETVVVAAAAVADAATKLVAERMELLKLAKERPPEQKDGK